MLYDLYVLRRLEVYVAGSVIFLFTWGFTF